MYKIIFVFGLVFCGVYAKHEEYEGHSLYQVTVENTEQAQIVNRLENELNIDIWSYALPSRAGNVLVPRDLKAQFQRTLQDAGIQYTIEVDNIREKIELEDELLAAARTASTYRFASSRLPFNTIHRYAEVDAYLVQLANSFPDLVTVVSGGNSFEGRDIKYLKISTTNFQNTGKPIVMMESLLHAREWVTLPATLYAIESLLFDINQRDLLENIDWIIVPIANPDGYEFCHTTTRFWRKNRSNVYSNSCPGVDLNRNFDFLWASLSSSNVCSETFHGGSPFSEPEAAIIGNIIQEHRGRIELFLDIHSFGSWMLYGFGNGTLPPNGLAIHVAGVAMAQAIDAVKWENKPNYVVGNSALLLYGTSGSAQDFAQDNGVTLSYTYELPAFNNNNGLNGFLVDPNFILQAGFETWQGIRAGGIYVLNNYRKRQG